MIDIKEFLAIQDKIKSLRRQKDKLTGVLEEVKRRLKTECNCDTVKQAKEQKEELESQSKAAKEKYAAAEAEFEKKWNSKI